MTAVLVDTSVVLKWFHAEGEGDLAEARALLAAHRAERITAYLLDLSLHEVGNVLMRSLRWPAAAVADQLDDLVVICGPPLVPDRGGLREAAGWAAGQGRTFSDASFGAAASGTGTRLISADKQLLAAGLAESPRAFTQRMLTA